MSLIRYIRVQYNGDGNSTEVWHYGRLSSPRAKPRHSWAEEVVMVASAVHTRPTFGDTNGVVRDAH